LNAEIEKFTIGRDRELDLMIASHDVIGSIAHVKMLEQVGLISADESGQLVSELRRIYSIIEEGKFKIDEGIEDVHSQLEKMLTDRLGDTGRKVHTGRSRNDQVLLDIQLLIREELSEISEMVHKLFTLLLDRSEETKDGFLPGYTHFQVAMPSSFGLWFGAYAEGLADDMIMLSAAWKLANQNPLGSAAGYGTSLPLNRRLTTELLAFEDLRYNVVNAQMSRGKIEQCTAQAISVLCGTISRFATDLCMYNSQNFGFITLPDEFTTGSSIMPHKKNPDVFELIRARCNRLQALPYDIGMIINNLPSGYHRDYQVVKELLFPAFQELKSVLQILTKATEGVEVNREIAIDDIYRYVTSVEEVNRLVTEGTPFREAYKIVARNIQNEEFRTGEPVLYTHEGSMGNLCNEEINEKMNKLQEYINYETIRKACSELLGRSE